MAVRRLLGYVPQQLSIEAALTGRENVDAGSPGSSTCRARERKARVADALEAMGLGDAADRLAGTYSGGMVRRLELAQALVNRPALLVLDEPTVGLDPVARDGVWQRVEELRDATGMTVLLTTHYMEEADALCDRIALMHLGRDPRRGLARRAEGGARAGRDARGRLPAATPATRSTATRREGGLRADPKHSPHRRPRRLTGSAGAARLAPVPEPRRARSAWSSCRSSATTAPSSFTRAVQPVLWLVIFGETFNRLHAIPTGGVPYLDFLAPGIIAQSAMFVAIFYGIQIIWERDAGVLTKLLVTPTPRSALILGKSFAAGIRALAQVIVVLVLSALLGVSRSRRTRSTSSARVVVVMLGAAFFSCLSMTIAGVVLKRDRLMGIGQMITMPLFFASNALYPVSDHAGLAARAAARSTRSATRSTRCAAC